jgi:Peptidase A4 family
MIAVCVVLAGCGGNSAATMSRLNFGSFAGYGRLGPVRSIGADLTVPRIGQRSGTGVAATWIGAQTGVDYARTPFIQVGVIEARGGGRDRYFAFWTDTARGFSPVPLFSVRPGDRVATGLVLRDHRWTVAIADPGTRRHVSFTTDEEGHASFHVALWVQEDPLDPIHQRSAPYPVLSGLQFAGLTENGAAPAAQMTNVQWMSRGDQVLTPTALDRDAFTFTLHAPSLTPVARRYLALEQVSGDASLEPLSELAGATAATGHAQELTWARQIAAAFTRGEHSLDAISWPRPIAHILADNAHLRQRVIDLTHQLATRPASRFAAIRSRWVAAIRASALGAARLHRALNAPSVQPPSAEVAQILQPRSQP